MKYIELIKTGSFSTVETITVVAKQTQKGITVDEMRLRCRILDAVEKADPTHGLIEDADHKLLVSLMKTFPFAVADKDLLGIIDAVINAKDAAVRDASVRGVSPGDEGVDAWLAKHGDDLMGHPQPPPGTPLPPSRVIPPHIQDVLPV